MLIFLTTKQFYDYCDKHIKNKFVFEFDSNNHYGLIVLKKNKRIIGRFELGNEIYLDCSVLSEWK